MARDENDRPYEDGQGRSLNPALAGDVLSPGGWNSDDTDEQPAIVISPNETYILPDSSAPADAGDALSPLPDALYTGDAGYAQDDYLRGDHAQSDYPGGEYAEGEYVQGGEYAQEDGTPYAGDDASGAHRYAEGEYTGDAPSGSAYLPLDKSYDASFDDAPYDDDADGPKRGFLGAGYNSEEPPDGEREVRRRTKVLLAAAAAVVVLGAGAGWMLTSNSADDPCAGGHCASVGQVTSPSGDTADDSALPELDTDEPTEEPTDGAADPETDSPDPAVTQAAPQPSHTAARVRTSHAPTPRATRTRAGEPTAKPSARATRSTDNQLNTTRSDSTTDGQKQKDDQSQSDDNTSTTQSQAPAAPTQAPEPAPKEDKGLLGILFPWA